MGCVPDLTYVDGGMDAPSANRPDHADAGMVDATTCPLHATRCDASADGNLVANGDFRCGAVDWSNVLPVIDESLPEELTAACGTLCVTFDGPDQATSTGAALVQARLPGAFDPGSSYELTYEVTARPVVARILVEIATVIVAGDAGPVLVYANADGGFGQTMAQGDFAQSTLESFTHEFTVGEGTFVPECSLVLGIELQGTLGEPRDAGEVVCFQNVTLERTGTSPPPDGAVMLP
jgi:hypothetical protein